MVDALAPALLQFHSIAPGHAMRSYPEILQHRTDFSVLQFEICMPAQQQIVHLLGKFANIKVLCALTVAKHQGCLCDQTIGSSKPADEDHSGESGKLRGKELVNSGALVSEGRQGVM